MSLVEPAYPDFGVVEEARFVFAVNGCCSGQFERPRVTRLSGDMNFIMQVRTGRKSR
jgi:hypothetical protein